MSGHNKWSTIKHKKGAADARRGKIFSKIVRELHVAVREGGADLSANATLRAIVQKARTVNMPADNIERAIKKASGEGQDAVQYYSLAYEGYGAGGVGIVILALTDNKNRTSAEVRFVFSKAGYSMAQQGAVSRSFQRKGLIEVDASAAEEDFLLEKALEAGAEDMVLEGDCYVIETDPSVHTSVAEALEQAGIPLVRSEVALVPETTVPVTDPKQAAALLRFMETVEELDDVQSVYANFDISDELMEELGSDE